ncbi:EAL domain-containing protein [Aquabacterium sp.]|uniref:EAL domain-containing protein n=1 Tax=Aquabacterium sp. TaxID=1872578 RepID=UPI0024887E39|nr:EAL domain-containing protein [Aquabacterium sp.]MDI1260011.1 EAL domain-containing protein [Aquabacterium sp.]
MNETNGQPILVAESEQALHMSRFMLDRSPMAMVVVTEEGQLHYVNEAAEKLLGYSKECMSEMTIFDIAPHRRPDMWHNSWNTLRQMGSWTLASDWRAADGHTIPVELNASYLEYGTESYIVLYAHDTSGRQEAQAQSFRVAHFDVLTGLPNSQMLQDRLQTEAKLAIHQGRRIALLAVAINEIQKINESLGYALGDQLLLMLTRKMTAGLRRSDTLAYMGTGEFMLLMADEGQLDEDLALQLSRQLQETLSGPINLDGTVVKVSCDIGIVLFPQDGDDEPRHALRQAEAAMRMAQAMGPDQICFFTDEANAKVGDRLAREAALREALVRQELYLQYQPQIDLGTGQMVGAEALVRWRNALFGDLAPDDFLPMAEETELILEISTWVLVTACESAVRWQQAGLPTLRMAVNMSAKQLNQPDIARSIETILRKTGLDPHCLSIEVTESMLMNDLERVAVTLGELKSIGVHIALDDFGTGYSSLANLRRLPIDVIKIGRSLVPDVTAATQDVSVTRAIINLAHSLQMKVMAVGVESDGEVALLVANQCDQMQGFYFSEPLHEPDMLALLREKKCLTQQMLGRKTRKRTLLLVDDEESIVSSLKRLLRRDGYDIVTANSGPQGLQRLAEYEVDVILSDQRMPGMTGVELLRRAKELYPKTVRMVLSGYTELQSITDAINEGAIYKFLTKPWNDELVRGHIKEAFQQKEMADENLRLDREVQGANLELAEVNKRLQHLLVSQQEQIDREETSLSIAREVLENIPTPLIGFDPEGMVAFMNTDAEKLFHDAGTLLGMRIDDLGLAPLADLWRASDGFHHDIDVNGLTFRAVCRPMTGASRSRGALMVLTPQATVTPWPPSDGGST